jgi:hypothetical protein
VPATARDGALYFFDRDALSNKAVLRKLELASGQSSEVSRTDGDVFDESAVLADDRSVYALATVQAGSATELGVLAFPRAGGAATPLSTGSKKASLQLAQDALGLYVAAIEDGPGAPGPWQRTSRIVRIDKASGQRTVLATTTVETRAELRGGFFGLKVAGDAVLAIEEGDVAADGTYPAAVVRVALADGVKTKLLEHRLALGRTEDRLLGLAGRSVLAFQTELGPAGSSSPAAVATSTLWAIDGGAVRTLADFVADAPLAIGAGVVNDGAFAYWMNHSGRIFKIALAAL